MAASLSDAELKEYILSFDALAGAPEVSAYLDEHFARFKDTLALIPQGNGRLLEIGASPFCMTILMRRARNYEIALVNYGGEGEVTLRSSSRGETLTFPCVGTNVETEALPFADGSFAVVLCAEVLEHLTFDPAHMLAEIHRVLARDGLLVLTTPNVLRLVLRYPIARTLLTGGAIYGAYSGYGPYGRHNREFTPDEVRTLVEACGFTVCTLNAVDVGTPPGRASGKSVRGSFLDRLYTLMLARFFRTSAARLAGLRGGQILLTATPGSERRAGRPDALYVSQHARARAREIFPRIP